mgnify:CR=1 FL=1
MPPLAIDEAAARVQAGCPSRYSGPVRHPNDPQRSVSDESPRRATIPATRRKTREKKQDEFPGHCIIRPETYHAPRATEPEMRPGRERSVRESGSALRSPGARKARATGFWVARIGPSRQKRRASPEYLLNPITHFVTPAVLGGVFGSYFPMAGNPLAWSRLENACTWHIRYINAYDRSAKYFSIPKPG